MATTAKPLVAFLASLAASASLDVQAREWRLTPDASTIAFSYVEDGETETGVFERFAASAWFDPEALGRTELTMSIDMASIDGPDPFRESIAKGVGWFEVERHPEATFRLQSLRLIEGDRYEAVGVLTVKSIAHPITAETIVAIDGDEARVTGAFVFPRRDYKLGGGPEELFFDIDPDVAVRFDLLATAADG